MKVAIAGYGIEGEINYRYWKDQGNDAIIFDEAEKTARPLPPDAKAVLGVKAFEKLQGFDLVVRTASLRPDKIKTDAKVWSATNEFFAKCPAEIIGVTGTKGKGTTSSLIAEILKAAGKTVHLLGNIGTPALEILPKIKPDDLVVFELSSFQLWDLEKSPHIAVVLMLEADHLDIHTTMEEYVNAKANIRRHQDPFREDICIYHPTNKYAKYIAEQHEEEFDDYEDIYWMTDCAVKYGNYTLTWIDGYHGVQEIINYDDKNFYLEGEVVCPITALQLVGEHNKENASAAIIAATRYTKDFKAIEQGLRNFKGLPHRLEFVRELEGVKYYDDSIATGAGSTIAAMEAFGEQHITLILGGSDKGLDISPVINKLDPTKHFVVLIGSLSDQLEEKLKARDFTHFVNLGMHKSMVEIVQIAASHSQSGGIVLLSPAHASFDMFSDYAERGNQFKAAVAAL